MFRNRYKLRPAVATPISSDKLAMMLDPEHTFALHYPYAFDILTRLTAAHIRVNEFSRVQDGVRIGVLGGVVIMVFSVSGKVHVQGDVFEHGATGKILKKVLPKTTTTWQR